MTLLLWVSVYPFDQLISNVHLAQVVFLNLHISFLCLKIEYRIPHNTRKNIPHLVVTSPRDLAYTYHSPGLVNTLAQESCPGHEAV